MTLTIPSEVTCKPYAQYRAHEGATPTIVWIHKRTGHLYSGETPRVLLLERGSDQIAHAVLSRGGWIAIWWYDHALETVPAWIWGALHLPVSGVMYDSDNNAWVAVYKAHNPAQVDLAKVTNRNPTGVGALSVPGLGQPGAERIGVDKLNRILREVAKDRDGAKRAAKQITQ